MNCCKNQNENDENKLVADQPNSQVPKHNHKGHMLHMVLCCGLPLLVLLVLALIGYKGALLSIAPFICPIMMLVMMPMMMRGHGKDCSKDSGHTETKSIEEKQL